MPPRRRVAQKQTTDRLDDTAAEPAVVVSSESAGEAHREVVASVPQQKLLLLAELLNENSKRSLELFQSNIVIPVHRTTSCEQSKPFIQRIKRLCDYGIKTEESDINDGPVTASTKTVSSVLNNGNSARSSVHSQDDDGSPATVGHSLNDRALTIHHSSQQSSGITSRGILAKLEAPATVVPEWHAPWKMYRVISGHLGWLRSVAVDPTNQWFATGSTDRTIKIWDLASGQLKLTLTGHISAVRALQVSHRHPYLFSAGEDKKVLCWDLECNKAIRHYHGHLSGVYCMALHPTLDLLVTGARDSTVRVWDMRSKNQVLCLTGHDGTVASVATQGVDPQIISGAHDSCVKLWDLAAGKAMTTLTHHKKAVRALAIHPREFTFASASADNIKHWLLPQGKLIKNFSGHNAVLNTLSVNSDGVCMSGADNGSLYMWDWKTGYNFQRTETIAQPGSLDSEAGIFCSTFDRSGARFITGEADKTIKMWKEDDSATPDTHPVRFHPSMINSSLY